MKQFDDTPTEENMKKRCPRWDSNPRHSVLPLSYQGNCVLRNTTHGRSKPHTLLYSTETCHLILKEEETYIFISQPLRRVSCFFSSEWYLFLAFSYSFLAVVVPSATFTVGCGRKCYKTAPGDSVI